MYGSLPRRDVSRWSVHDPNIWFLTFWRAHVLSKKQITYLKNNFGEFVIEKAFNP